MAQCHHDTCLSEFVYDTMETPKTLLSNYRANIQIQYDSIMTFVFFFNEIPRSDAVTRVFDSYNISSGTWPIASVLVLIPDLMYLIASPPFLKGSQTG